MTGTSSPAGRAAVEGAGAAWVDYRGTAGLRAVAPADAVVDHTGARALSGLVRPGRAGGPTVLRRTTRHERADTFRGSVAAVARTLGRPAERVVSVPAFVAARPAACRAMLTGLLRGAADGRASLAAARVRPPALAVDAHREAEADGSRAAKTVLTP